MTENDVALQFEIMNALDGKTCARVGTEQLKSLIRSGNNGQELADFYGTKSATGDIASIILTLFQIVKTALDFLNALPHQNEEKVVADVKAYLEKQDVEKNKIDKICGLIKDAVRDREKKAPQKPAHENA